MALLAREPVHRRVHVHVRARAERRKVHDRLRRLRERRRGRARALEAPALRLVAVPLLLVRVRRRARGRRGALAARVRVRAVHDHAGEVAGRVVALLLRDEHAAAGPGRVLAEREVHRLVARHAAGRVQRRRLERERRALRRLVQERDDLRRLFGASGRGTGDVEAALWELTLRRADMWSGESELSHRRTQSRSFFSCTTAVASCRLAHV